MNPLELSEKSLKRKVELCEELLEISNLFDGGWSIFRGNLLIELQETVLAQALSLENASECKAKLKQAAELLQEISNIMNNEPEMQQLLEERRQMLDAALARFAVGAE